MKKIIMFFTLFLSLSPYSLHACTFWITNDSSNQVILVSDDMLEAAIIPKNKTITFGDSSKHAKFKIFSQLNSETNYKPRYKIIQKTCTQNKKIELSLSNLEKGTFDKKIISVEKFN